MGALAPGATSRGRKFVPSEKNIGATIRHTPPKKKFWIGLKKTYSRPDECP